MRTFVLYHEKLRLELYGRQANRGVGANGTLAATHKNITNASPEYAVAR
jgi:hypothetical protein